MESPGVLEKGKLGGSMVVSAIYPTRVALALHSHFQCGKKLFCFSILFWMPHDQLSVTVKGIFSFTQCYHCVILFLSIFFYLPVFESELSKSIVTP